MFLNLLPCSFLYVKNRQLFVVSAHEISYGYNRPIHKIVRLANLSENFFCSGSGSTLPFFIYVLFKLHFVNKAFTVN